MLLVVIAAIFGLLMLFSASFRSNTFDAWAVLSSGDQLRIREYIQGFGAWGPVVSVALMTLQVIIAPIPASVVQLANGVVYGMLWGTVLNVVGQFTGAAVSYFIARSLGRGAAERFAGKFNSDGVFEQFLERWGAKALFLIRAIPGMPSDFVSYFMGLTTMAPRRYLIVSFLGYIPQSLIYAFLGDRAMDWFWWVMLGGFAMSSILALIVWKTQKKRDASAPAKPVTD